MIPREAAASSDFLRYVKTLLQAFSLFLEEDQVLAGVKVGTKCSALVPPYGAQPAKCGKGLPGLMGPSALLRLVFITARGRTSDRRAASPQQAPETAQPDLSTTASSDFSPKDSAPLEAETMDMGFDTHSPPLLPGGILTGKLGFGSKTASDPDP